MRGFPWSTTSTLYLQRDGMGILRLKAGIVQECVEHHNDTRMEDSSSHHKEFYLFNVSNRKVGYLIATSSYSSGLYHGEED